VQCNLLAVCDHRSRRAITALMTFTTTVASSKKYNFVLVQTVYKSASESSPVFSDD